MSSIALTEAATVAASAAVSAAVFAISSFALSLRKFRVSRQLANKEAFESALESADLITLGKMLRDRFGNVSVESLLDDATTQEQVFKSLKRLTEVVNQPAPDEGEADPPSNTGTTSARDKVGHPIKFPSSDDAADYVDLLAPPIRDKVGAKIMAVAKAGNNQVHGTDLWTALARARRALEHDILPLLSNKRSFLSHRSFQDPQLRTAFGIFLSTANRAIHGEDIALERAEQAMDALHFVGSRLRTELSE